jgi:DNA-binding response OmpR family regulator
MIQANIQKARMEFCHATYGEAGLALLEEKQPHLVLLDLMLPDMTGYDVCARIRRHSNVPVIMVTARTETGDQLRGLQCGADDYVIKPFDPTVLLARIASHLRRNHRYNAVENEVEKQEWAKCQACGYMGPQEKFEELDDRFQLRCTCPHCKTPVRELEAVQVKVN